MRARFDNVGSIGQVPATPLALGPNYCALDPKKQPERARTLVHNDFRASIARLGHPGERRRGRGFVREGPNPNAK